MEDSRAWRLERSQYFGEISALCFLPLPSYFSPLPYLLAGTGSQVLLFDLNSGRLLQSFDVFEGIRVHGISCGTVEFVEDQPYAPATAKIIIYGERRVKLFALRFVLVSKSEELFDVLVDMALLQLLPRFNHWVLDVLFLKDKNASSENGCQRLAVGCSDNSVHIWNILASSIEIQVKSSEKCLLYSMRLWGQELGALLVASGTIFNEVVVWKVVLQHCTDSLINTAEDPENRCDHDATPQIGSQKYVANTICRLLGHQGSIFRLSWSANGSKLISVSDDRSARVWNIDSETNRDGYSTNDDSDFSSSLVLYGHNARVWDCCIFESLIVTAGEDCTCRLWGSGGSELKIVKEHIGRGIWRCLYDPQHSLLVTAGFDSAIKVRQFGTSLSKSVENRDEVTEGYKELLKLCLPNSSEYAGFMDSRSEYVRCVQFASSDMIYIATNNGYVYHVQLSESGNVKWNKLVHISDGVQIICMDFFLDNLSAQSTGVEHWIAVGDGKGGVTVLKILFQNCYPKVDLTIHWQAEAERQLLRVFWCKSLGYGYLFTSDPRGNLKLWRLLHSSQISSQGCMGDHSSCLVAEFKSSFAARIMCLDASIEEKVVVCGDLRGNLTIFPLPGSILLSTSVEPMQKMLPVTSFKGAHGISAVSNISLAKFSSQLVDICSTGADGCVCYLEYDKDQQILEFVGMKQVKELSLVESIFTSGSSLDSTDSSYAVGFSSTDFLVWNMLTEAKVVQIACGGWRRPHSYYLGCIPERKNCFAYVKDEIIYVHRQSVKETDEKILPQNIHVQFHGREIHCVRFILTNTRQSSSSKLSWIATGCEDGTVRLTRYNPGIENWSASKLLGEHVGGSAVRSLYFVSSIQSAGTHVIDYSNGTCSPNGASENFEHPCLLISVGAKRVLTSWLLRTTVNNEMESANGIHDVSGCLESYPEDLASISFKWLSTDMPTRSGHNHNNIERCHSDDNDWRFLAVTAFLLKIPTSRLTVCFVVVAASDATLNLRALVLPHRYWFDVATLAPLSSPVLALQHVVTPLHSDFEKLYGDLQIKNKYIVISGCTDGSVAFWDLSETVEDFVCQLSSLHLENSVDFQKRPRTGRGSQGGRWRRSIGAIAAVKKAVGHSSRLNTQAGHKENELLETSSSSMISTDGAESHMGTLKAASTESEASDNPLPKAREIVPLCVLNKVHQSGVNCLYVSENKDSESSRDGSLYDIVSGGDDQALTFLKFNVTSASSTSNIDYKTTVTNLVIDFDSLERNSMCCQNQNAGINFLYTKRIASAHSSAVKGVWTDGTWVFSTGLDQRVRCWRLDHGKLTEHSQLIISVPEPEALDARACGRNYYEIVVAGRGMQMVEFSTSGDAEIDSGSSFQVSQMDQLENPEMVQGVTFLFSHGLQN
ncbi:hypothetical protein V2J09_020150 [Rumex salicifolius]